MLNNVATIATDSAAKSAANDNQTQYRINPPMMFVLVMDIFAGFERDHDVLDPIPADNGEFFDLIARRIADELSPSAYAKGMLGEREETVGRRLELLFAMHAKGLRPGRVIEALAKVGISASTAQEAHRLVGLALREFAPGLFLGLSDGKEPGLTPEQQENYDFFMQNAGPIKNFIAGNCGGSIQ